MTFRFNTTCGVILCNARLVNMPNAVFTKMAVDTGATFTMIPKEHALAVGLPVQNPKKTIEIATANGKITVPFVT
ncbi:MAG: retroviral-like aspartic protease family protein, partial [Candidatus Portnoybacteria bacterium]|nr:retroviral-like aspartic protease family protein [Candidatus Portnoybacteria bacterium]